MKFVPTTNFSHLQVHFLVFFCIDMQERSTVIATYACCGFGSIAAVGVYIGALVSVAPQRRGDISEVAIRAVVNGNVAGFLTACIAGE